MFIEMCIAQNTPVFEQPTGVLPIYNTTENYKINMDTDLHFVS